MSEESDEPAADVPSGQAPDPVTPPVTPPPAEPAAPEEPDRGPVSTARPLPRIRLSARLKSEVRDALLLLDYVVSTGYQRPDGTRLTAEMLVGIKNFAALTGLPDDVPLEDAAQAYERAIRQSSNELEKPEEVSVADWVAFEAQYYALSIFVAPVTAETLKNTTRREGTVLDRSPAQSFTVWLWYITLFLAVMIIWAEWGLQWYGLANEGSTGLFNTMLQYASVVQPYLYGGLGACAYLLRSAHKFIYERTFDLRRRPEYFNRILLGAVSGGAIVLLVNQITDDDGNVIRLSSAALGFLAGYSNDFLFNVVERILQAILPKVGINTIAQRPPMPALAPTGITVRSGDVSLDDLLAKLEKATTPEDKEFYRALILKAQGTP